MKLCIRSGFLTIIALLFWGCSTMIQIIPDQKIFDLPPIGIDSSAELGDTIVSKGKTYEYDGIELITKECISS